MAPGTWDVPVGVSGQMPQRKNGRTTDNKTGPQDAGLVFENLAMKGSRSQALIVFRDRLVHRAISLIGSPSRSCMRRTFAYIAMVCTSSPCQSEPPAG